MKLSDRQSNFLLDVARLIFWCHAEGYKVTSGEMYRTQYQQDEYFRTGYSRVKHSQHQDRLAVDLNFFVDGVSMWQMDEKTQRLSLSRIGEKWESLRVGNRWGGNFSSFFDPGHFEFENERIGGFTKEPWPVPRGTG